MKKYFLFALVIFTVFGCNREPDIIGVWVFDSAEYTGTYHFMSESKVIHDFSSGSSDLKIYHEGTYFVDASKNPMWT